MGITTDKLDKAVLKHLRAVNGKQDASVVWWQTHLQEQLGELCDYDEVVSTVKRLRTDGTVRLRKYSPKISGLHEYHGSESDHWFFGFASFEIIITDQGRRYWDVPRRKIGFQQSA